MMFQVFFIVSFATITFAIDCGTITNTACPSDGSKYVYLKGSISPGTGQSVDVLNYEIIGDGSKTTVRPYFGFNCLPTEELYTNINHEDWTPDKTTCSAMNPVKVQIPLRAGASYSGAGVWYVGLKICDAGSCGFKLTGSLLQGICGQSASDWQLLTASQTATAKPCSLASSIVVSCIVFAIAILASLLTP